MPRAKAPPKQKTTGRKPFSPTDEQRNLVKKMVLACITHQQIAKVFSIDPKTLRKHFSYELEVSGLIRDAEAIHSLYRNAIENDNVTAQIFIAKTKRGWKETSVTEHTGKDGGAIDVRDARESLNSRITGIAARIRTKDDSLEADTETSGSA